MSGIRGSLQELVARLAALDEQREALRAVIAQRLGLAGAPRIAQATQPRVAPVRRPVLESDSIGRAKVGARSAQVIELARAHGGVLLPRHLVKTCGLTVRTAADQLAKMAKRGQLRRLGIGRYALPEKTAPGPRLGTPSRQRVGRGAREAEALALAADLAAQGESLTRERVARALGITAHHAKTLMAALASKGKLQRVSSGIYALPGGSAPTEDLPASGPDTDQTIALAIRNGGIVDIAAILAAGIKSKHALAAVMLRKLHARGRLERVAPETYATPDKAAQMRTLRKMDRAADKRAEETP